ncbi:SMI1/KNR4 family protein [Marininema halotolerans]|uniref:SMI1-KNR4 cell-wall n=1 Tax=Marininema halotolerans TaxID=1155944 RepID=A0A1I6PMK5_9BACL|nr:SMI1/KNR4 family protein [Marininema halotolerans]SFS41416.1 SMI1-KNR4 cell-wall [Marininema halotolerans]
MSKQEMIVQMMRDYAVKGEDYFDPMPESKLKEAEALLEVNFPDSYKWYIQNYGHGGLEGVEILGIAQIAMPVVETTIDYRQYGLPQQYIVIEDCGEYVYCLDTSRMENEECPIINWAIWEPIPIDEFDDFYSFLIDRFQGTIDNMDDDDEL